MFGFWPSCAYHDCPMPALFQVRNVRDGEELTVDLCIVHLRAAPSAVQEMQGLRHTPPPHLLSEEETVHGQEEA